MFSLLLQITFEMDKPLSWQLCILCQKIPRVRSFEKVCDFRDDYVPLHSNAFKIGHVNLTNTFHPIQKRSIFWVILVIRFNCHCHCVIFHMHFIPPYSIMLSSFKSLVVIILIITIILRSWQRAISQSYYNDESQARICLYHYVLCNDVVLWVRIKSW